MALALRDIRRPDFGEAADRPTLPATLYDERCRQATERAGCDWLVVYADREHQANMVFLTGFEPRFEEALLLLGSRGERIIVTGNENQGYTPVSPLSGLTTLLAQSLSLMAQDRSLKPDLVAVLSDAGIRKGDRIALAGWKYVEPEEWHGSMPGFFVPSFVCDTLRAAIGPAGTLVDATAILMHPTSGLRSVVTAPSIAEAEWGAARASDAVWRMVSGFRLGDSERQAAARMGYAGEPMTCHPMMSTGGPGRPVIGLSSPSGRIAARGDGATCAVGYWGGLTARAGMITDFDDSFLAIAKAYVEGLVSWYRTADISVEGGTVHEAVVSTLARGGLASALNPGHLTGHDEWIHSPIRPGSTETIGSGMPFQVDIIPVPMIEGQSLNCEDTVTFADATLRADIRRLDPALADRFDARRDFVRNQLGFEISDNVLLLSNMPLCLMPFWLAPNAIVAGH